MVTDSTESHSTDNSDRIWQTKCLTHDLRIFSTLAKPVIDLSAAELRCVDSLPIFGDTPWKLC